jgi:signal transduction histidine kinase
MDFPLDRLNLVVAELSQIHQGVADNFRAALASGMLTHQWNPSARLSNGILSLDLMKEPTEDSKSIVIKMGAAFNLAYQRFLDLQKAESQTREAEIELALERVRAKTMAMQQSRELRDIVASIYEQLRNVGFTFGSCSIVIMDKLTGDMEWWIHGFGTPYPESYLKKYFEHPFYLAQLNHWKEGKKYAVMETSGADKKAYDDFIFNKTNFINLPIETQNVMKSFEKITFSNAYMKYGSLSWAIDPLDDQHAEVLQRFAAVFEQSYTRFLDLQIKEEQSVKLVEEKQKLEVTLNELRTTQSQLIQKEKLASLGELTAGIAHEIQNPLNFVNNFSELNVSIAQDLKEEIEKSNLDKEFISELLTDLTTNQEKINLHGKRASSIVKGMLEHSRSSTGEMVETNINALCDEYLRLSYLGMKGKDHSFNAEYKTDFDENMPKIKAIPQDIGRVLLNLINNAFYAVNDKAKTTKDYLPTVTLTTKQIESQIEISIKDNGNGIPENIKSKIFQPFFTTKPTGEGTGLGLSLSYDIVTKGHGGTLKLISKEGEGSEFIVQLPFLEIQ